MCSHRSARARKAAVRHLGGALGIAALLLTAGCVTTPTAQAQSAPLATSNAPPPAPPPAQTEQVIQPASFDSSHDPLFALPQMPDAVSVIRARVNNVPILEQDLRAASFRELHNPELMRLPAQQREDYRREILNRSLQDIIDRELLLSELQETFGKKRAEYIHHLDSISRKEFEKHIKLMKTGLEKNGYPLKDDPRLTKFFAIHGTTVESYRRHFERNFMMMEFLRALIYPNLKSAIGHREIFEYYDQHGSEFDTTDNVVWLDLFIDVARFRSPEEARRQAESIRARAVRGDDFAELVKQFDQGDSNWRQGEGIGHRRGEIRPPELEPVLFQLKAKDVGPVIEVATGFHVVKVTKREYTGRKPLDADLQSEIRR
jgi:hypothetical protein